MKLIISISSLICTGSILLLAQPQSGDDALAQAAFSGQEESHDRPQEIVQNSSPSQVSSVQTSYGEITIPTYPWQGHDDINPHFRWTSSTIYPYPMQDNLSRTKMDKTYKTLILENEYLKVIVTPELGGHVHSVIDKVTGENVLYENKVLKPSLIGLRGAWSSGGIEFNTGPQGHTVTCLSPVEAKFVDFADGSKGIAIGNVEQVYHTQWVAVVRLRPGRAFLEERIRIYNPTGNRQLYYFWNCVAVPNTDSTQFIYPMTLGQDHAGTTFYTWPIHQGKDISWLKNFDAPSSIFSYRCDQDFYGSYDHALDRGTMTYANHFELEGKKSWTWSKSPWGLRAQAGLTDDGSCYNEIQTGPLPTQADYGLLEPHQTVEWKEWWYPVRGTKGVAFSTKDVTVNLKKDAKQGTVTVLLHGTGTWEATCRIEGVGGVPVRISPEKPTSVTFSCKNLSAPMRVSVTSGNTTLAQFTYPLPLPKRTPPENPRTLPSDDTAAGCWLRGIQWEKEGKVHLAREWFEKAIQKDANFAAAFTSLGELQLDAGQFEDAKNHLEKSLKLNPDDGWAKYYLAQTYLELGQTADALEMAYHAAHKTETATAGYSLAGAIHIRLGEFACAIDPLKKAIDHNGQDLVSRNLLTFALWKAGDEQEATDQLAEVQARDPLDIPSGVIQKLMGKDDPDFTSRIAGRKEEVMDAVDFFLTVGLKEEAITVLKTYYLEAEKKDPEPLAYYYHGILANDAKSLVTAMEMSPDYGFPNRRSSLAILQEAIKRQPKDWKARYYLGNLLFERARKEEAVRCWQEAVEIDDSYSVLHRNLGLVAWRVDNDIWKAISCYEKALSCNPNDFTLYRDLATLYVEHTKQYNQAMVLLENARARKCIRADVAVLLGRTYLYLGETRKALDILLADTYTNWEGQGSLYSIYTAARIGEGQKLFDKGDYEGALQEFKASIEFPQNLGPGQMSDPPDAESRYWIGAALEKLGKPDEAVKEWRLAAKQAEKGTEQNKKYARDAAIKLSDSKVKS